MNYEKVSQTLEIYRKIVLEAGERLLERSDFEVDEKTDVNDIVTSCDRATQDFLVSRLSAVCPEVSFLCEENDVQDISGKHFFVIDPIDGTTNFVKHYNQSAISVAYADHERVLWGIIYNPYTGELFEAADGCGAFLNGQEIQVTDQDLRHSIVSFGTSPYYKSLREKSFKTAMGLMDHAMDIRRSGSAALDLCYVASGRTGLYFEYLLSPWDFAAGLCIVREAGGTVVNCERQAPDYTGKSGIIAGTAEAVNTFFEVTEKCTK